MADPGSDAVNKASDDHYELVVGINENPLGMLTVWSASSPCCHLTELGSLSDHSTQASQATGPGPSRSARAVACMRDLERLPDIRHGHFTVHNFLRRWLHRLNGDVHAP